MNITILNGNPEYSSFDTYLTQLKTGLETKGHSVVQLDLCELTLRYCIGCFGCWVKTPGVCSSQDESCEMRRAVIHSDFTLWAAPLRMGFPSALLKMALDKSIPLIHPYAVVDRGEAHHRPRYDHYPRLGLLIEPEADTDSMDLEIIADIFSRTAINLKSRLEFSLTSDTPVDEIANRIINKSKSFVQAKKRLKALIGERVTPPNHLTIFNGSPRGRKGNTPIMLKQFAEGFASMPGKSFEIHNLNRLKEHDKFTQAFANAECVWLGFPLYTDAMPGMVKAFIETLAPLRGRKNNPPIGFLVQSGFPETLHSRHVERYLQKLTVRLNAPYLGTIVKGGGEGVRMMSDERNAQLFEALQGLGRGFSKTGQLNPELLKVVAGVERYSIFLGPIFRLFLRLPIANGYWDTQLKENGVYEERFARPYIEKFFD
ncbi:MAG: flavodoxin family protein [Anaerolineales bacterium]|nr:flavodoxin family protein [Chloroflexota bacterium]MBL6983117.1 flavodoxin family protein [Anaerolineales bacterium]